MPILAKSTTLRQLAAGCWSCWAVKDMSGMYNYRRGWAADLLDDFFFVVFATFIRNETKQVVSYGTCTIGGDEDESMGSQGTTNVRCGGGRRPDLSPQLIWCNFVTTSTRECVVRLGCVWFGVFYDQADCHLRRVWAVFVFPWLDASRAVSLCIHNLILGPASSAEETERHAAIGRNSVTTKATASGAWPRGTAGGRW